MISCSECGRWTKLGIRCRVCDPAGWASDYEKKWKAVKDIAYERIPVEVNLVVFRGELRQIHPTAPRSAFPRTDDDGHN